MAKPTASSLLVVGVDLGATRHSVQKKEVRELAAHLLRQFDRYQIAATWTVPRIDAQTVAEIRGAERVHHEIALQWDALGVDGITDVFQFNAILRDRVAQANELQVALRSLSADPRSRIPYCALSKAGIRTVRPSRVKSSRQVRAVQPTPMRFSIWGVPVSCFWPHSNGLMQRFLAHQLTHQTRIAAHAGRVLHVVLDVPRMADATQTNSIDRFLGAVAELRQRCTTFGTARLADVDRVARLKTMARPARSILKRAG